MFEEQEKVNGAIVRAQLSQIMADVNDTRALLRRLADATTSTDGDRNAARLLHRAFDLVQQWSDQLVAAKKSMDTAKYTTSPNALREDPLSQKLITCGHFVTQMLGSGTFQDDPSCR